jgi:dihydrolipoamide dehydrogenase
MKTYDLIVIGSGGGTKISTPSAKAGHKVAIIEKEDLGGTCLNRGCIPSKMFIHPANQLKQARELPKYFINHTGEFEVDFMNLANHITDEITTDSVGIGKGYEQIETLDLYRGAASFVDDHTVLVNGEELTAPLIIIATGSRPSIPPIPGLAGTPFITSREALRPEKLPKRLLVIGGGYIASELGHAYRQLGSETIFFVRDIYLAREDETIQAAFQTAFEREHPTYYDTKDLTVDYHDGTFTVRGTSPSGEAIEESGDGLFIATGVVPNTDGLGLDNTAIERNERGYVTVNDYLETTVPGVYALGDVAGNYLFRHSVNFEGEYLYDQLFGGAEKAPIDYPPMPHAVFSNPEIAGVGMTEQELRAAGANYLAVTHAYENSAQGMARRPDVGLVKLLFDRDTRELLGAHIIGEEAATMVHQLILAMTMKATSTDLLRMIYIHPALPEIVRNAVRKAEASLNGKA